MTRWEFASYVKIAGAEYRHNPVITLNNTRIFPEGITCMSAVSVLFKLLIDGRHQIQ
jgi:hypothetical protein